MNIFETIGRTTSRTEPFHSRFLADALRESMGGDRRLFDAVWRLTVPDGWQVPQEAKVCAELPAGDGRRIDIAIKCASPASRIVGIEVKTTDSSATAGQLERYHGGLTEKHRDYQVAIAYLTPFNRQRAGDKADALPTIREFDEFRKIRTDARHVSWLDIADIPWDGNELWRQHQAYVRSTIASDGKLHRSTMRDRALDEFFGGDCVDAFWQELSQLGIEPASGRDTVIDLTERAEDADRLARAFEILVTEGDGVARGAVRKNNLGEDLRGRYLESPVHRALFGLSDRHSHVWLQGKQDYGLRVAHERYTGGVSLVRSDGPGRLQIVGQR